MRERPHQSYAFHSMPCYKTIVIVFVSFRDFLRLQNFAKPVTIRNGALVNQFLRFH